MLQELEGLLHTEIPLSRAMGARVVGYDVHGLHLQAPLAPNLNHKQTAFGGSLAALATLAGWGLLQLLLRDHGAFTVVIQESRVQYLLPVTGDFTATAAPPAPEVFDRFRQQLARKGRARIEIEARIPAGSRTAVEFQGRFVAFDQNRYPAVVPA